MNNKQIIDKTEEMALEVISEVGRDIELVDVEYVKEGSAWYLRVFIDKPGGVDINDCVDITNPMNERLDEKSFINEAYIFEVSSPGLDRPLKKDKDFDRNIGNKLEIKLFAPIDGEKEFIGILLGYDKDELIVDIDGDEIHFERKMIALIRQAIDF